MPNHMLTGHCIILVLLELRVLFEQSAVCWISYRNVLDRERLLSYPIDKIV
jgi:hypothetical protein